MLQKKRKFDTTAFLFIAPAFILFTVFLIVPTVSSFYYSFTSWDGINPNIKFIGFDNYKEIFTSARFGNALNFRGFPSIPGDDLVTRYPNETDANSGAPLRPLADG